MSDAVLDHVVGPDWLLTVNTTAASGQTRDCLDPWRQPFVIANGDVWPCCWFYESLGNLGQERFDQILNGPNFQALRLELLTGNLRPACVACPSRALTTPEHLLAKLRADT